MAKAKNMASLLEEMKKVRTRYSNLKKFCITKDKAWNLENSRKSYWRILESQVLAMSLTNKYLTFAGYDDRLNR